MPVDISIIIVNYNVQYFIEQCLNSIFSISDFKGTCEVIVIDNDSSDGSVNLIKDKFKQVRLIENEENVGFSVANNQGIEASSGKYSLLLNPDTILEEDTLSRCFNEMESDPNIGALGVKMVDGAGKFLPESKRGFPSPMASFYRFTGIYKLFPKSKKINQYYQGHIEEEEKAEVDILCGAFMFIRRTVLNEVGFLDEAFFMYGEDIDLSFRIRKAGYRVMYFPQTTIIHFKGESTRKDSIRYTQRFYNAMDIFAKKHFKDSKAAIFLKYLSLVIYLKAGINLLRNSIEKILIPLLDAIAIYTSLNLIAFAWAKYYFEDVNYYQEAPLKVNFVIYTLIWFIAIFYGGGYDKKVNIYRLFRNIIFGTVAILAVYGLLDPLYRSSRAIILLSTFSTAVLVFIIRISLRYLRIIKFDGLADRKNLLIIAKPAEAASIENVLRQSNSRFNLIRSMPVDISNYELREIIDLEAIDEVICNIKDVGMKRVIELMSALGSRVAFKITGEESLGIIGSQSKNRSGEIYTIKVNYAIQDQSMIRIKRTFDIITSLLSIILAPIFFLLKEGRKIISNSLAIFVGSKTLVGYDLLESQKHRLPNLGRAVFNLENEAAVDYARNYTIWKDFRYLWKALRRIND